MDAGRHGEVFANDPLELLAVDARANRAKGDGDAATWLPPNKSFRCSYVARQVAVKTKYRLWVTQAEKNAIGRVLATCPGQKLPAPGAPVHVTASSTPTTSATTPTQTAPSPAPASAGAPNKPVSEVNCSSSPRTPPRSSGSPRTADRPPTTWRAWTKP